MFYYIVCTIHIFILFLEYIIVNLFIDSNNIKYINFVKIKINFNMKSETQN